MDEIGGYIYINLDFRTDRQVNLLNNLQQYQIDSAKIHRIAGLWNSDCGHIGCGLSHMRAVQLAQKLDLASVVILEDDFEFCAQRIVIDNIFKTVLADPNIDLLNFIAINRTIHLEQEARPIKKVQRMATAMGYLIKKDFYPALIANFQEAVDIMTEQLKLLRQTAPNQRLTACQAIDQNWNKLIGNYNFYLTDPTIGKIMKNNGSDNDDIVSYALNNHYK